MLEREEQESQYGQVLSVSGPGMFFFSVDVVATTSTTMVSINNNTTIDDDATLFGMFQTNDDADFQKDALLTHFMPCYSRFG